jgi:uncharacterized membrane protein YphA (DoxX/SURF4 family)
MKNSWFNSPPHNNPISLDIIRIVVAFIILMHPLHGMFHLDNIPPFGEYLSSLGFPFGLYLAWLVLITQMLCSALLFMRRLVVPACMGHIFILSVGIWFFHRPNGWYVVGPGERGMEFSVLMIACLVAVALAYWPRKAS